jgi:hypothetical protein
MNSAEHFFNILFRSVKVRSGIYVSVPIFRSNMIMALFAHDQFGDLVNSQLTGVDDLFHG